MLRVVHYYDTNPSLLVSRQTVLVRSRFDANGDAFELCLFRRCRGGVAPSAACAVFIAAASVPEIRWQDDRTDDRFRK